MRKAMSNLPAANGSAASSQSVIFTNQPSTSAISSTREKYAMKINRLAVPQIILGLICMATGAAIAYVVATPFPVTVSSSGYYSGLSLSFGYNLTFFTTGEGMWCGVWIVIAGAVGTQIRKNNISPCRIKCQMVFSILASIFSTVMLAIGVVGACIASNFSPMIGLYSLQCALALSSLGVVILSASYSCCAWGCCSYSPEERYCCTRNSNYNNSYGEQIAYAQRSTLGGHGVVNPYQETSLYPALPNVQQEFVVRSSQPIPQTIPNVFVNALVADQYGCLVRSNGVPPQVLQNTMYPAKDGEQQRFVGQGSHCTHNPCCREPAAQPSTGSDNLMMVHPQQQPSSPALVQATAPPDTPQE